MWDHRDTTEHRLGSFHILKALPPHASTASVEPLDYAKSAADFDPFFESPDINVFAD